MQTIVEYDIKCRHVAKVESFIHTSFRLRNGKKKKEMAPTSYNQSTVAFHAYESIDDDVEEYNPSVDRNYSVHDNGYEPVAMESRSLEFSDRDRDENETLQQQTSAEIVQNQLYETLGNIGDT